MAPNQLVKDQDQYDDLIEAFRYSKATAEYFGCGPLNLAVIAGDIPKVEEFCARLPSTLFEVNSLRQTPIHLASGHISCLRALIRYPKAIALINDVDLRGHTALEYAARRNCGELPDGQCTDCLKTILQADCMIPQAYYYLFGFLCQTCAYELLQHIKNRRQRLKRFAQANLASFASRNLGLESSNVLDSKAHLVMKMLHRQGVCVPESLSIALPGQTSLRYDDRELSRSVFHFPFYGPSNWDVDYDFAHSIGFRDLDQPDIKGCTPLYEWRKLFKYNLAPKTQSLAQWRKCIWLIEHGADPWARAPCSDTTVAHHLYMSLAPSLWETPTGSSIKDYLGDINALPYKTSFFYDITRHLSLSNPRDACCCKCSAGGCPPINWFLRKTLYTIMTTYLNTYQTRVSEPLAEIIAFFLTSDNFFWTGDQLRSVVRLWTFEALELRHTCNHNKKGGYVQGADEEEINEILEEDHDMLSILEDLVDEFETKLNLGSEPEIARHNVSFWSEIWLPRVKEVRNSLSSDRMGDDQKRQCEEIGVVWHDEKDHGQSQREIRVNWPSDVDKEDMWLTFKSVNDWESRLRLIVSQANSR